MSQTLTDNYTVNPELNSAIAITVPPIVTPAVIQQDLYFGRNIPVGGEVSEEQFQAFIDNVVTPRFRGSFTFNTIGRFQDETNNIIGEQSNVVTLVLEDTVQNEIAVNEVLASYQEQFQQSGSLRVVNKDNFKATSPNTVTDLIDNDPIPQLIQADLYFGRNIPGGGEVSEVQFQAFLDGVVTPQFSGLTAFNATGQGRDEFNNINREQINVVTLILEDTQINENAINNVLRTYQGLFGGAFAAQTINEGVQVSFGPAIDLIDNDLIPEFIQADLYFGRNIIGGEVSDEKFLGFIDDVIAPRFIGLTAFDTIGQTRDAINNITRERSNVVTLILEDTQANEDAINDVLTTYQQQFLGAGVLQVIDENVGVFFDVLPVNTISGIGGTNTLSDIHII
ncbi:DUF3574 domain-containing protein [Iningainema tapete]|uniref:DUF3574 domain-containing protein n=1 Tax=Iningainema tapete BLCC-T55 TaxID=2748662 RepID=A0A8J6XS07_9CYAN|nr:DUF3574 domain-containing protein [Iningainema tapete]MBD2778151.1 DUF3574 domain-containing protein [Iningainema tapete BLCC-T55]